MAGIPAERILVDPGIGFRVQGDAAWHLLPRVRSLRGVGAGVLVGHSRKRFLGALVGESRADQRDVATATLSAILALEGVDVVRVHNPRATRQAVLVAQQWRRFGGGH